MDPRYALRNRRSRTRLALLLGVLAGVLTMVFYVFFRPSPNVTFGVFYSAAESAMAGEVVYETEQGLYVYTPVVLLFFYPFAWLFDFPTGILAFRLFSVLFALGYGALLTWFLDQHADLRRVDRALVFAFVAGSVYPVTVVATANMGIVFGSLLGIGFVMLERGRDSGGAVWALASLVKGFPALWGLYLLRVRRWKAVGAAVVTGLGATLLGLLLYGLDAYVRFFTVAAADRVRLARFAGGNSPDNEAVTLVRPLSQIFQTVDPHVWPPIIAVVVVAITAGVYALVSTADLADRATILLATVVGVTLAMPTSQDLDVYLVYAPLLVLLFLEREPAVHALYALATVVLSYNVGREELRSVTGAVDPTLSEYAMLVGEPVLAFASMPLWGLLLLYAGCVLKAWRRGHETGRIEALERRLGRRS